MRMSAATWLKSVFTDHRTHRENWFRHSEEETRPILCRRQKVSTMPHVLFTGDFCRHCCTSKAFAQRTMATDNRNADKPSVHAHCIAFWYRYWEPNHLTSIIFGMHSSFIHAPTIFEVERVTIASQSDVFGRNFEMLQWRERKNSLSLRKCPNAVVRKCHARCTRNDLDVVFPFCFSTFDIERLTRTGYDTNCRCLSILTNLGRSRKQDHFFYWINALLGFFRFQRR